MPEDLTSSDNSDAVSNIIEINYIPRPWAGLGRRSSSRDSDKSLPQRPASSTSPGSKSETSDNGPTRRTFSFQNVFTRRASPSDQPRDTQNEDLMRLAEQDNDTAPSNVSTAPNLEGIWINDNCFLELSDAPVEKPHRAGREHLGHGRTGIVEEVQCSKGTATFVRKRIEVPSAFSAQRENAIKAIKREIGIMRKVHHPHIVSRIGSYQEKLSYHHYYFLLMYPTGESDLEAFLRVANDDLDYNIIYLKRCQLQRWFGCLASALAFLHRQGIHHEDIKPRNIIHREDDIYFTDFGSSREVDLVSQITSTENPALSTRLYAAPEAMRDEDGHLRRHGSKSDVFSLGIVFVEMLIVLEGAPVSTLREGFHPSTPYHAITQSFKDRFDAQKIFFTKVVEPCLALERSQRLSASELLSLVGSVNSWRNNKCSCQRLNAVILNEVVHNNNANTSKEDVNETLILPNRRLVTTAQL